MEPLSLGLPGAEVDEVGIIAENGQYILLEWHNEIGEVKELIIRFGCGLACLFSSINAVQSTRRLDIVLVQAKPTSIASVVATVVTIIIPIVVTVVSASILAVIVVIVVTAVVSSVVPTLIESITAAEASKLGLRQPCCKQHREKSRRTHISFEFGERVTKMGVG